MSSFTCHLLFKSNFLDNLKILHHSKFMSFDHPKTLQILFKDTFFLFPIITSYNEINIKFDLSFTVTVSVLCPLIKEVRIRIMVFITTFNSILIKSWCSVLLVKKNRVQWESQQPAASHWQTLSYNFSLSTLHNEWDSNSQL